MVDPSVHKQSWETHTRRQSKWLPSRGRSLPALHTILCLSAAVRILLLWMWFSYEKHVKQFIAGWQQLTSWMFLREFVLSRSQRLRLEVYVQEREQSLFPNLWNNSFWPYSTIKISKVGYQDGVVISLFVTRSRLTPARLTDWNLIPLSIMGVHI